MMCFKLMSTPYSAYVTYSPSVHTVCTKKNTDTERSTGEVFAAFLHAHCMLKRIWHFQWRTEQQRKHAEKQSCKGCLPKEFQDASMNQNRINDLKILKPPVLKWDGSPIINIMAPWENLGTTWDNSIPSTDWSSFSICSHFQTHMTPVFFGCAPRYARHKRALVPSRNPPDKWQIWGTARHNWSMASPLEHGDLNIFKHQKWGFHHQIWCSIGLVFRGEPWFLDHPIFRGVPFFFP